MESATAAGERGGPRRGPTPAEAFGAQLRLVGRHRFAVGGMTMVVATALVVQCADVLAVRPISLADAAAGLWTWGGVIPLLWPFATAWKGEGPSDRAYHWTLPVDRARHQLLRTGAGWVLLVAVLAVGLLLGWIGGVLVQGSMAVGDPEVLAGLLPAATVAYLVGAGFALLFDRPVLWLFVSWVGLGAADLLGRIPGLGWIPGAVDAVFLSGAHSLAAAANLPRAVSGDLGGSSVTTAPWEAAGLWLVVASAAVALSALVHLEREGER